MTTKRHWFSWTTIGLTAILSTSALAELKGTNATFYSWDDDPRVLTFQNSNSSIIIDGQWHPFFAALNFDNVAVDPAAQTFQTDTNNDGIPDADPVVQCSLTDTDGNGLVGTTTPWAGSLRLALDHADTGVAPLVNGFRESRCWELAVCDREGNGTGSFEGADRDVLPRYRRFTIDVAADPLGVGNTVGACPTPSANVEQGWVNPLTSNGFIYLIEQDTPNPCDQTGRCDLAIDTDLYILLDRDCDGFLDDENGADDGNNDSAIGNLALIGDAGAGRIPRPVGNNDPQLCFYAEGKKPDFTLNPQWSGNIQTRITAPAGGSGDKTVNHNILNSPVVGDVGDLPGAVEEPPFDVEDVANGESPAYPPALHITNTITNNPFIGPTIDNNTSSYFTIPANGDDSGDPADTTDDEDGVILPSTAIGATYTATVNVSNSSGTPAKLCGWFDFNQNGAFENSPNTSSVSVLPGLVASDTGERSCLDIPTGTTAVDQSIAWTIPLSERDNVGQFYFRFRISQDPDFFDPVFLSAHLGMESGEVEDYTVTIGTLPVSIAGFDSRYTEKGLQISWVTASETRNAGFLLLGDFGEGMQQLNAELIPAQAGDALTPRTYTVDIPDVERGSARSLAVTAVDFNGKEDIYGVFEAERHYGQFVEVEPIDWSLSRDEARDRDQRRAENARSAMSSVANARDVAGRNRLVNYVDLKVTEPGLQEVSWSDLTEAGLDLAGVRASDIAVTLKGEPVPRDVVSGARTESSSRSSKNDGSALKGDRIRFWGELPQLPDALYLESYVYRVSVDPARAIDALAHRSGGQATTDQYLAWSSRNVDASYQMASPLADPWYEIRLDANRRPRHSVSFHIDEGMIPGSPGGLRVRVAGLTDLPADPDHHVFISVNGQKVDDAVFDGQEVIDFDVTVPAGVLVHGENVVTIEARRPPYSSLSLVLLDTVELGHQRRLRADEAPILAESIAAGSRESFLVEGLDHRADAGYAWDGRHLFRLDLRHAGGPDASSIDAADAVIAPTVGSGNVSYWLSKADMLVHPTIVDARLQQDLLAGVQADFLVIAHPAFLPLSPSEDHPLNDYIAQRQAEGWRPHVFDVAEIQAFYGGGMPLPDAVTEFLRDADQRLTYEHVLLVGGDSYDYNDHLGLGSISFIPTRYASTSFIPHTPSDALLADLDDDGLADKALGRWPVRSLGDLQSIVTKTLDWPLIDNPRSTVWVVDSQDHDNSSFAQQAERMIDQLEQNGWQFIDRLYYDDLQPLPGMSVAETLRENLFYSLEKGRALTGFIGHGSPTVWTWQGVLGLNDLNDLNNEGNPTVIGTMTCYTSYFVSPQGNSLAHQWMNGYRTDASGAPIPGTPNGAAAIHGASTLSDYSSNEIFLGEALQGQGRGLTIGMAIELARTKAWIEGRYDQVTNWTLLGDPTLRLSLQSRSR
jgi:hypothetical protein